MWLDRCNTSLSLSLTGSQTVAELWAGWGQCERWECKQKPTPGRLHQGRGRGRGNQEVKNTLHWRHIRIRHLGIQSGTENKVGSSSNAGSGPTEPALLVWTTGGWEEQRPWRPRRPPGPRRGGRCARARRAWRTCAGCAPQATCISPPRCGARLRRTHDADGGVGSALGCIPGCLVCSAGSIIISRQGVVVGVVAAGDRHSDRQ